jgi:hypothetical protein
VLSNVWLTAVTMEGRCVKSCTHLPRFEEPTPAAGTGTQLLIEEEKKHEQAAPLDED